jgi:seryl-tRNA synthetase
MYDLAWFRANFDRVAERLQTRSNPPNLDGYRELDKRRRAAIAESEQLKARRNAETTEIAKLRREGADTTERQQQVRAIAERIALLEAEEKAANESFRQMLEGIPNVPHESVPVGSSEADNEVGGWANRASSTSSLRRTGTWDRSWASWTWSARRR